MKYFQLGNTDLNVSPLALGAGQFGTGVTKDFAFWQLDTFTGAGANFIDTAHVYGDWVEGERARSEKIIGEWLRKSGKRDKMVIMTKGAHPLLESMNVSRCTPENIETDINESLQCLGVDCIDLYLLHRDNPLVPVAAILETLEKAQKAGKIRYYGFSNWKLPRAVEALSCAQKAGIRGFSCNQIKWSLAETNAENISDKSMVLMDSETYDWHAKTGTAVTAYTSTAHGWFSKLEKGKEMPEKLKKLFDNDKNRMIYDLIKQAASGFGTGALAVSLAYIRQHPFASVPITSFSRREQLEEALGVCEAVLSDELMTELNFIKGFGSAHRKV